VIVTSDHGEEFNDTGKNYWGHNGNFSPYQVAVPLLVRGPVGNAAAWFRT
jgi:membrane-anchored protein YejM (alkaline phosphatase superfamily)